jgi:starch phosphorylase
VPARIPTDVALRIEELEDRLVPELRPLARVAYDYRWSWTTGGAAVFEAIDRHRWRLVGQNPVEFLFELSRERQHAAAQQPETVEAVARLAQDVAADESEPDGAPVAFFCAEFGVHTSLPIYSGGLGVLAGDFLKEASDRALPLIGIGLFYRRGYFCQRIDLTGSQQEYWLEHDPALLPLALVRDADGAPLRPSVRLFGRNVAFHVWCVQVGRVPLLLLDAELAENGPIARWTTARLYDGNSKVRLAQYGLLGMGGARVLEALGIEPAVLHLNEGHPALAPLELAARKVADGATFEDAIADVRERVVFTTHTPLPAGNESYAPARFLEAFGDLPGRLGLDDEAFLDLCRITPGVADAEAGMSPLAMRVSQRRNGVSRLHGEVARTLWEPLFAPEPPPIDHVTNGVHVPTFLSPPFARLFAEHLGEDWLRNSADPATWEPVRSIPNAELWRARNEARRRLVEYAREKALADRLLRGEELEYAEAGAKTLDAGTLTFGFARRLTAYKRLALLVSDVERARKILVGPPAVQLLISGKAHPRDEEAKKLLQRVFALRRQIEPEGGRVAFLENYDLAVGRELVAGCDVWVNLPMRGLEASGTSGMKAVFNGGLHLSVLDGWWAEAYNEANGWAIPGDGETQEERDSRDADTLYTLLEEEIVPLFYERDADGVPNGWCERIKESLVSCGPTFTATRMLDEYRTRMYSQWSVRTPSVRAE